MEILKLTPEGLFCEPGRFHIDPWKPVEKAIITHAHGDHANWGMGEYICVREAEHIMRKRIGAESKITLHAYGERFRMGDVQVSFHPAGHILGSSQVRIEYKGEIWLFTGDFKRDPDLTCAPFEVVPCDVFISEATFSLPVYSWPPFDEEIRDIHSWWMKNREEGFNSVLCCYALGKSQRIIAGLRELTDQPIWVHGTVDEINRCYEQSGLSWKNLKKVPLESKEKFSGAFIICPPSAMGSGWAKRVSPKKIAFASGWMRLRGNRRRKGYDRGFVISDHADWKSLVETVKETGCKKVLFTHGNTDVIVRYMKEEVGIPAFDLKLPYEVEGET